jgi:Ca2+-transporting ATPase
LVCGDICILSEGINLTADGLILEGKEIEIDESAMTGETDTIKKVPLDRALEKLNSFSQQQ